MINIFIRRKSQKTPPSLLLVEGVSHIPLTPVQDEAETAALALLEKLAEDATHGKSSEKRRNSNKKSRNDNGSNDGGIIKTSAYYHAMAERIHAANTSARYSTMRFVSFCEQELKKSKLPFEGEGSLQELMDGLYECYDTAEREKGNIKDRWQQCMTDIAIRNTQLVPSSEDEEQ